MQFEYQDLEFGRGSLAELIAYDRYCVTSHDIRDAIVGDVILFLSNKEKGTQKVGTITFKMNDLEMLSVEAHDGSGEYSVDFKNCRLMLETKPAQLWHRWARGAASVEKREKQAEVENNFRWLLDGFKYVPGGRIQLMLGQEFMEVFPRLPKSKLTAYNCLVLPSPACSSEKSPIANWLEILKIGKREANAMAFGSGVGINISTVPARIPGPKIPSNVTICYDLDHPDVKEFQETEFTNFGMDIELTRAYQIQVEDSRFGIFDALEQMVQYVYEGKDVVLDVSLLRGRGAYVKGIDGVSSGAVSWARLFDFVVGLLRKDYINAVDIGELYAFIPNLISQGGQRRGALMLVLDVDHQNIREYVGAKQVSGRITGANLSVNVTDAFIEDLAQNDPEAEELFDYIAELAHRTGEPGILFVDRANRVSNTSYYQEIFASNPCGEQFLPPDGVCNLGAINLPMFIIKENRRYRINFGALGLAVDLAVRFQDNVIDYGSYFDDAIKEVQTGDRRVGIGTMGLATLLIRLGIRYGSEEAKEFIDELYGFIARHAYLASSRLGEEKGSFPKYNPKKVPNSSFLYKIFNGEVPATMRNAALLTQAPTGSTGTMIDNLPGYNCSTGIEPYFAFNYYRAGRLGVTEQEVDLVKEYRAEHPGEELPGFFVTAQELTASDHVAMQAQIQKWVDNSISKTINMPEDATVEDVKRAYHLAHWLGCKGVTVYRDGSRAGQVLATKKEQAKLEEVKLSTDYAKKDADVTNQLTGVFAQMQNFIEEETAIGVEQMDKEQEFKKRPKVLYGKTIKQATPMGKMYVTINTTDGILIEEVFIHLSKSGSDIRAICDAMGIMLTLALSERLSSLPQENKIKWLVEKLKGIKGAQSVGFGPNRVDSLPDALGKIFAGELIMTSEDSIVEPVSEVMPSIKGADICPECGMATLIKEEGCEHCACGYSRCS